MAGAPEQLGSEAGAAKEVGKQDGHAERDVRVQPLEDGRAGQVEAANHVAQHLPHKKYRL